MQKNNEILVDYLDKQLSPEQTVQVETMIRQEAEEAGEYQYLKLAVETVCEDALRTKVSAIRASFDKKQSGITKPEKAIVRGLYKTSLRAAAVLVLLLGSAMLYKYVSVNNRSVYEKQFTGYELNTVRGPETPDAEVEAYRDKNWNNVINQFKKENIHSNRSFFLTAIAEMQLNHFSQAVGLFEKILDTKSGDNSFREEAEYYISLAYLMNHQESMSILMLNKIKSDTSHTYYQMASKISPIDLKIIKLKK